MYIWTVWTDMCKVVYMYVYSIVCILYLLFIYAFLWCIIYVFHVFIYQLYVFITLNVFFYHKILTFIGFKKHSYIFYIPYLPLVLPGGQQTSQGSTWLSLTCRPLDACCLMSNNSPWATEKVRQQTLSTLFPATFSFSHSSLYFCSLLFFL